jgi:hypothetical protein
VLFADTYPKSLRTDHPCEFRQLSSAELADADDRGTAVTFYLYRLGIDEQSRNTAPVMRPLPLYLALYFLAIVWADDALAEQTLAAWAMPQLNQHPSWTVPTSRQRAAGHVRMWCAYSPSNSAMRIRCTSGMR